MFHTPTVAAGLFTEFSGFLAGFPTDVVVECLVGSSDALNIKVRTRTEKYSNWLEARRVNRTRIRSTVGHILSSEMSVLTMSIDFQRQHGMTTSLDSFAELEATVMF